MENHPPAFLQFHLKTTFSDRIPPRIGTAVLRRIYGEELFDDVYGDLHEMYLDRVEKRGLLLANIQFITDAVLSIRNYDLKTQRRSTQNNTIAMFKNYLKITVRTISKNKVYSTLNILGLALGIAACLFILQ